MKVWQYPLKVKELFSGEDTVIHFRLVMPVGARILSIQTQKGMGGWDDDISMWALVNPGEYNNEEEVRHLVAAFTGKELGPDAGDWEHRGTAIISGVVIHFFEVV